jgi:hypothetical protein
LSHVCADGRGIDLKKRFLALRINSRGGRIDAVGGLSQRRSISGIRNLCHDEMITISLVKLAHIAWKAIQRKTSVVVEVILCWRVTWFERWWSSLRASFERGDREKQMKQSLETAEKKIKRSSVRQLVKPIAFQDGSDKLVVMEAGEMKS